MKQFLLSAALIFFITAATLHAEEGTSGNDSTAVSRGEPSLSTSVINNQFIKPASLQDFIHQTAVFAAFEPMFILNTEAGTKSAPSPVVYPISIGISWPDYYFVSFQPRMSFYYNYYLWNNDDQTALPAEVENRTATALSCLFTLPAVFSFHFTDKTTFEAEAGVSFLLRTGILSNGVSSTDSGTSGSAESDTELINNWFRTGLRFLYAETGVSWLFDFTGVKAGPEIHFYLPVGSLVDNRGLDAMMLSGGIKLIF
ncbi:MAG: hypothetical protein M0P01_09925 [Treponema sp.]|nr:hypothetical protein [Treponema sp.]